MVPLPRPASPRALWKDIKTFLAVRRPYQVFAALAAVAIPTIIIVAFIADTRDAHEAPATITYVDSWGADRSIEETRATIRAHDERRKAAEDERRRSFQKLEDFNNRLGI